MSFREPDELSAYLASLDLQPYAQYLHAQDIHSLADLRLLTADDLAACGIPPDDAAAMLALSEAPTPQRAQAPAFGALQAQAPAWEPPQTQAPAWEPPRQYEAPYKQRAREFQNCRGGKTSSGRSRARTKAAMADAEASAPALANALRGYIAMKGGSIQAQQLAEFYKSPACAGLEVPKGGALKLLRNVENSGLRFTHMPHLNKWIIALDHDAPPPPPASDLRAGAEFVPGAGYAPVDAAAPRMESDPRLRQLRMESLEALSAVQRRADNAGAPVTASGAPRSTGYIKSHHPSGAKKKIFVPTARPWTRLGHNQPKHAFTVVSYNVLSQKLLDSHRYLYHTTLRPRMRLANLQKEIGRYGAQIVCLQEIEPEHLEAFTGCVRTFKNDGEDIKRGAEVAFAPCGFPRTDGVAVLVDAGRFTIVHENALTLDGDEGKKNAGLVVTLADKEASGSLIVACAHLLFNPKRGDARLRQCVSLLRAVEEAKQQAAQPVRVVVCGDFNSYPDSAVYAFLARGSVASIALEERTAHDHCKEHPSKSVNGRCVTAHEPYQDVSIVKVSHSLALESVYASGGGEPGFTTYLPKGTKACVDYVWSSDLVPVGRLEPPPLEELRDGLPSQKFPSDHVALVARFAPAPARRA